MTLLKATAAIEWVRHNRVRMATDQTTIAEVIGTVKGVIPNSKLASYGDFRLVGLTIYSISLYHVTGPGLESRKGLGL